MHRRIRAMAQSIGLTVATAVAFAGWANNANAQDDSGDDRAELFTKLDANGDGQIAADEVPEDQQRLVRRLFRSGDEDGNGTLSRDEFTAALAKRPARDGEAADAAPGDRPRGGPMVDPERLFTRLDANGDGKVTADEIPEERRERMGRMIERLDANGDGATTLDEFRRLSDLAVEGRPRDARPGEGRPAGGRPGDDAARGGEPGRDRPRGGGGGSLIAALDANGDGALDADEIDGAAAALKKLDRDGDGRLTSRELGAPGEMARQGRPGGERPDGQRPRPERPRDGGGNPQTPGAGAMIERLKAADRDGDGKLSRDEAPERMAQAFDRIDSNGDGFLDSTELRTAAERLMARGRRGDNNAGPPGEPGGPRRRRPQGEPN